MRVLFIPVFRVPVSYLVSFGRRWSVLEQLLLVELAQTKQSVAQLSEDAQLPERLIVEALINLMRAGWIEVRSINEIALFSVTELGKKRAAETKLKAELKRRVRRASLCMDRLTGSWLVGDGLDLVHERELPPDAEAIAPLISALDTQNGEVRELLPLEDDEAFERLEPNGRTAARFYARVEVSLGEVKGLGPDAPWRLCEAVLQLGEAGEAERDAGREQPAIMSQHVHRETLKLDSFVVGGPANRNYLRYVLGNARTHAIIHSCFLHPDTLRSLIPDFEAAAARKVRVELLWGLVVDPEDLKGRQSVTDCVKALETLSANGRSRVSLSSVSSSSHLKAIVADCGAEGAWETAIGSCNFLSSWFDLTEISVRITNPQLVTQVLGYLVDAQLPASGGWSPLVVRLNRSWNSLRRIARRHVETGDHGLQLLRDRDHHACVRYARDSQAMSIMVGCDLFGLAGETSVLVPMERAHELGKLVTLAYRRPSKALIEQGAKPDAETLAKRGLNLQVVPNLHGKFLAWGDEGLAVTSFNWLSTAVGARTRGAELGVMIEGPGLRAALAEHMKDASPTLHRLLLEEQQGSLPLPLSSPSLA